MAVQTSRLGRAGKGRLLLHPVAWEATPEVVDIFPIQGGLEKLGRSGNVCNGPAGEPGASNAEVFERRTSYRHVVAIRLLPAVAMSARLRNM
eukprot:CAMPEP_0117580134 /NCGR_PEP_ID=MMETSP0784-20121206/65019_1 /TAXON_ID=39447 /ORGANISM="" /LENGTH=91 /DNA_ID=CAMNT_0005380133 /DNA_START=689 /DNA_END=967 /DNA_ORIENTATION=-